MNEWTFCFLLSVYFPRHRRRHLNKSMFRCGPLKCLNRSVNPVGLTLSPNSESASTGLVMFLWLSELSCGHEISQQLLIHNYFKAVFENRFYPYLVFCPYDEKDMKNLVSCNSSPRIPCSQRGLCIFVCSQLSSHSPYIY